MRPNKFINGETRLDFEYPPCDRLRLAGPARLHQGGGLHYLRIAKPRVCLCGAASGGRRLGKISSDIMSEGEPGIGKAGHEVQWAGVQGPLGVIDRAVGLAGMAKNDRSEA